MEKNAQPSQIVPNSILCSSPSHTRGVNSLSPGSSRPLPSHRFSAHPPAQQLSPHKGLAEATQAEKTKEKRKHAREKGREQPGRRKPNLGRAPRQRPPSPLPPRRAASRIQLESTEPRPDLVTPCRAPQICARSSSEVAVRPPEPA